MPSPPSAATVCWAAKTLPSSASRPLPTTTRPTTLKSASTHLRDAPAPRDLFGLLRVERDALPSFFAHDEWPLEDAQALPGVTIALNGQPPPNPILRPVLTTRAFQLLIRADRV